MPPHMRIVSLIAVVLVVLLFSACETPIDAENATLSNDVMGQPHVEEVKKEETPTPQPTPPPAPTPAPCS